MGSTGHGLWSSCDWWILLRFECFCVSTFVSCDHNYDWWHWKMLFNFRVRAFVKSAVKRNGYAGFSIEGGTRRLIAAYFVFKSLFFALFWHLWLCWRASYFISDHLLLKNLLRTLVMKPAIPLCDMFCIFFTYIFVFGAQRLIIAFLSFSSCKQIKTSQQFFQSQLFCKQKNNIHVTCCGHCCFLAFHNRSHQTGLVISPGRAHIELSHDLKHKL